MHDVGLSRKEFTLQRAQMLFSQCLCTFIISILAHINGFAYL